MIEISVVVKIDNKVDLGIEIYYLVSSTVVVDKVQGNEESQKEVNDYVRVILRFSVIYRNRHDRENLVNVDSLVST